MAGMSRGMLCCKGVSGTSGFICFPPAAGTAGGGVGAGVTTMATAGAGAGVGAAGTGTTTAGIGAGVAGVGGTDVGVMGRTEV